jgi:hypothetical protein
MVPRDRTKENGTILWRRGLREGRQSVVIPKKNLKHSSPAHGAGGRSCVCTARQGTAGQRKGHAFIRRAAPKIKSPSTVYTGAAILNPSGIGLSGSSRNPVTASVEKQRHRATQFTRSEITFLRGFDPRFLPGDGTVVDPSMRPTSETRACLAALRSISAAFQKSEQQLFPVYGGHRDSE